MPRATSVAVPVMLNPGLPRTLVRLPTMVIVGRDGELGVTAGDGEEGAPDPARLEARTMKVYAVPFVRPSTTHDVVVVVQVRPSGDDVTW